MASCPSVYTSLFPSILAELILFSAFSVSLALSGICNSGPKFPILIAWWSIQVTDRPHKKMTVGTDSPPKALYIEGLLTPPLKLFRSNNADNNAEWRNSIYLGFLLSGSNALMIHLFCHFLIYLQNEANIVYRFSFSLLCRLKPY